MEFLKKVKYFLMGFGLTGVILLLFFITNSEGSTNISPGSETIPAVFDESKITPVRLFLISIEFIWLAFWSIFYLRLSKKAHKPASEETKRKIEAFEPKYFKGVAVLLLILLILSFTIPYFTGSGVVQFKNHAVEESYDQKINVISSQFLFQFDVNNNGTFVTSFSKDNPTVVLNVNTKYLFVVTTKDTTHGFGLYSPDGVLLGQNQIIPGYENYYYFTFEETGVYKVLCMEYCGAGHQAMVAYISVV